MDLSPICANSVSCIDVNCHRRHVFYLTYYERFDIKDCIDKNWKKAKLFKYKYPFPKKPNWCYDGIFCLNAKCNYHHLFNIDGRNVICELCKNEIEDVLIPLPE